MNKEIFFSSPYELTFQKIIFAESEVSLARCLNFQIRTDEPKIICDLQVTSKVAVIEFLKEAYPRVMNNSSEVQFKDWLLGHIDFKYDQMYENFKKNVLVKLGYEDKLYKHQKEALFLMANKRFNFLAFEMGTGKSQIAASLSKMLSIRRTLIICPASIKYNWMRELTGGVSRFNELYISLLDANKAKTIKAFQERFVIVNYEGLEKHMEHLLSSPFGNIILDEAVKCKSTSTAIHKNTAKIIDANPYSKVTMLSGAPIRNRIVDVFAYLKLVGHPLGKNYAHFLRTYAISEKGRGPYLKITGSKNTELLWRQMSNFFLRKKKEECLDLPPKIHSKLYFELGDYKKDYEKAVLEALEKSGSTTLNSCFHTLNIITAKSKLNGIIEFAESIIEQGDKVVIYSGYTEIVNTLSNHFKDLSILINGAVELKERDKRISRFINDESCKVFIANIIAGGAGINGLTVSSKMIFCDYPTSPADLSQACDRIHRIGQLKPCNYYYTIAKDSIDERLHQLIAEKSHDASKVIDNEASDFSSRNNLEILISELRLKYNMPELTNG